MLCFCSVFRKHEATILGRFYSGKLCYTITTLFYHMHYFTISTAQAHTVVATNVNARARYDIHRLNVTFNTIAGVLFMRNIVILEWTDRGIWRSGWEMN